MDKEPTGPIGEYLCPNCGSMLINDPTIVTITYPLALDYPKAEILCPGCDKMLASSIDWEDAMMFERRGANIKGFRFVNAIDITEEEITDFIENIDNEIKEFLDARNQ